MVHHIGSIAEPLIASGGGVVESFWPATVPQEAIQPVQSATLATTLNVGDQMVFAFEATHGGIRFGTADGVGTFVRQQFSTFEALPFLQTEMAEFLADSVLWEQAMQRCIALLERERPGSGKHFALNHHFAPRVGATKRSESAVPGPLS